MRLSTSSGLLLLGALSLACAEDAGGHHGARDSGASPSSDAGGGNNEGGVDAGDAGRDPTPSPRHCKEYTEERRPFFGDLHVHTALSLDANLQGTRLRPMDAHRFARGEEVGVPPYAEDGTARRTRKLTRSLDFVGISDHAEFLGLVTTCLTSGMAGYDSDVCKQYRDNPDNAFITINSQLAASQAKAGYTAPCDESNAFCGSAAMGAWKEAQDAANANNDSSDECAFTAFVAYEWSASPGLQNLHRNVIFRGSDVPKLPFSYFDGSQEEQLWDALDAECLAAGGKCDVLTIPHNSNLSAGLMFETIDKDGKPFDAEYAARRASFEPLVELIQHKGASECLPEMGSDELCNFEKMPYNNLGSVTLGTLPDTLNPKDYLRDTLGQGLLLQKKLGHNPFAYGFIGSTDTHMGTPGATEEGLFVGHGGAGSNARTTLPAGLVDKVWLNPGGLAVLWAEENSRDSLFDAMRRREAYATSGTRIVLRFFAGPELPENLCDASDFVKQGYEKGVPMGERLPTSSGKAPRFAVFAQRDPGSSEEPGMPLQRVQIIKGWVEGEQVKYAIHDVAGSAKNGASVDETTCEPRGQGQDELCGVWTDPDFDATQHAFYYARVLENPSCRWHARQCAAAGVTCNLLGRPSKAGFEGCCDAAYPKAHQERAWSSPIFHRAP